MEGKKRKIILRISVLLILIALCLSVSENEQTKIGLTTAQETNHHVVEIGDRFVILNWTIQENYSFSGFRIEIYDNSLNLSQTWSIIQINHTTFPDYFDQVNLVNYTDSYGEIFASQKEFSVNFTYFIVPTSSKSIQVKINGLKTSNPYQMQIYSTNSSIALDNEHSILLVEEEESFWITEEFTTLQSIDEALEYSKTATTITILGIILVFVIIFVIIAKIDVPFNRVAYVFIFPALFALVLLEVYPMLYGIVLSFTSYNLRRGEIPQFNWLENYIHIMKNPQLPIAFTTTLVWSTIIIFLKIFLGFALAYIIHYKVKRKKIWYLLLYLPWIVPTYIKILSWRTFIQGSGGESLFNMLFGTNVNLINQPYVALLLACFVEVWDSIPLITTLFLGGLSSIPKELNDIAKINQISERTSIRKIIIPLIKPIILPVIILEIIKTFGSFNVAFLFTSGYPLLPYGTNEAGIIGATDLFSTFTFYMFYQRRDVGIAAAYSTIMSILTLFFVLVWIKMSKGTESSFLPSEEKKKKNYKFTIPTFLIVQSIGYIVSGVLGFRYFGYHWNPVLTFIMSSFFAMAAMLFIWKPNQSLNGLKLLLALDLIFSLIQFFKFQMWYAFNWNIFVIAVEFFIIANIPRKKINSNFVLKSLRNIVQDSRKITIRTFQWIDTKLTDLNIIHFILVVQASILLISNLILGSSFWLMWIIFGINTLIIFSSIFSQILTKFSILYQPIIWIGLGFGWEPIGWKIIHALLSIVFIINYLQKQLNKPKKNEFLRRAYSILSLPINSSAVLLSISLIAFIPIWNIFWIAFSPSNTVVPTSIFPVNPTLNNFELLFTQENILLYFGNSLVVSLGSATLCILLTVLAAYAFSRYRFKVKKQLLVGVFIMKMFTGILTLIPFYLIMFNLGLIDTHIGVILAYSTHTIPLGLWLIKGYMDSIPKELDESALLMGNSPVRVLRKIVLPLAGPAIAIAFLLNFLTAWNGFLVAFVLLQSPLRYTLPIKLYTFLGSIDTGSPEWGMFAAASVLVMIPMIIMFILLRKYLLKSADDSMQGGDV